MTHSASRSMALADSLVGVLQYWEDAEIGSLGMLTGFHDLDDTLGGLPPMGVTVLAGRPGMGKTSLALNIARNVALRGGGALYCSLDDDVYALTESLLSSTARLDGMRFRSTGTAADWQRALTGAGQLYGLPLHLVANRSLALGGIRRETEILHSEGAGLELLVIDWVQLLPGFGDEIGDIARIATELGISVLVVSQLDRQLESRADKRPQLGDLLGTPMLEQRADLVLMLDRGDYYQPEAVELRGLAELSVVKNRGGPVKTFPLAFLPEYRLFSDLGRWFD